MSRLITQLTRSPSRAASMPSFTNLSAVIAW